jgi:KTSC domain
MPQVQSTAIREFEYRPDRNELYVQFTTGRKYLYFDVPAAVYRCFCNAGSFGEYFNCYIRDHYDFRELPS